MARVVACAVVREVPPRVFVAEDQESLNWVLARHLVAATAGADLAPDLRDRLRRALAEEHWGDAVAAWIDGNGVAVDVYPSMELYEADDVELAPLELQFQPLFGP